MNHLELTPVRRLGRLLKNFRKEIRYVLLYALVAGLIQLSLPLGIQAIIGLIAGGSLSASWGVLVFFVSVGVLLSGLLRLLQLSVMEYMQRRLFTESAFEFAQRIPRLNTESLRDAYIPELVNRFFDTVNLQKGLPKILIEGSAAIFQVLLSLIVLSFYHQSFVIFSILLLVVLTLLFRITAPQGIRTSLEESKYKYKLAFWLEEVGRVSSTFKLSGDRRFPLQRTDELTIQYLRARAKHWNILLIQMVGSMVFKTLVLAGFLVLGSVLVMENQLNIGQFVASEILILFVIDSVEKIILLHETGYDMVTAAEKLGQVSDLPLEREDGIRLESVCKGRPLAVEMRGLSYQFADSNKRILDQLDLKIVAGERVAIAGYTSSGRGTLLQILSVARRDFSGQLLFNGISKPNLHLRSLRARIGDISNHVDVFKGSILENLTLGDDRITLSSVLDMCESVGLSAFFQTLPQGINSEILPGGKNLSRSVTTKILVARALLTNPYLLVMDEPTASLQFHDRIKISRLLTGSGRTWTLVASTDDPLLASMCDRVLVMNEGRIIFSGTFDALQQTEHYKKLFNTEIQTDL
jgi:ABC-type bacteriocin/lantibiotic exporter with double-glycine peptidase domain